MAGTIINTGPVDPNYYRDQADRAARAMALFVAARRRRKEDDAVRARTRALEVAQGVAEGAIPPEAASVEGAIADYERYDPQGASELRMRVQLAVNTRKGVSQVNKARLSAKQGEEATTLRSILLSMPDEQRDAVIKFGGITDEDWMPKPTPRIPLPQNSVEARMQGLRGYVTMEEAEKAAAFLEQEEAKKKKEASDIATQKAIDDVFKERRQKVEAARREVKLHEEKRKIDVANPLPSQRGRGGATKEKEKKPTLEYSKEVYDSQWKANAQVLLDDKKDKRTPAQKSAAGRIEARADLETDPKVEAWIRQVLELATESGEYASALVELERKLREQGKHIP